MPSLLPFLSRCLSLRQTRILLGWPCGILEVTWAGSHDEGDGRTAGPLPSAQTRSRLSFRLLHYPRQKNNTALGQGFQMPTISDVFFTVLSVFVCILICIYFDRNLFEVTGGGKRFSIFKFSKSQDGEAMLQGVLAQPCAGGSPYLLQPPLPPLQRSRLTPLCPRTPRAQLFLTQLASPIISSI